MSGHDASKSPRDRLAPEMLLYGFVRAVGRSREAASAGKRWPTLTTPPDLERQVLAAEWETAVFEASTGRSRWTSHYGTISTDAIGPQT
jgi:hypothetical protein